MADLYKHIAPPPYRNPPFKLSCMHTVTQRILHIITRMSFLLFHVIFHLARHIVVKYRHNARLRHLTPVIHTVAFMSFPFLNVISC